MPIGGFQGLINLVCTDDLPCFYRELDYSFPELPSTLSDPKILMTLDALRLIACSSLGPRQELADKEILMA